MLKLYWNSLSPNSKRVWLCATELGLEIETKDIDFGKGENRSNDYMKLNPMGKVPVMDDDGWILWESAAMAWHLAESNPSKGLLPLDIKGRSDVMRWMFWNSCHLEASVHKLMEERVIKPMMEQEADEHLCESYIKDINQYLPVLNAQLEGRKWIGSDFSLADISVGVTVELAASLKIDLGPYTHLSAWLGRLQERPSWKSLSSK